jgi:hypothetical protein
MQINGVTMTLTAVKTEPSLDQRIASALGSTDQLASADLLALCNEVDSAIVFSDAKARLARKRSIDPLVHDGIAERGQAEDHEFISHRLTNGVTALREKYEQACQRERETVWNADIDEVELKVAKVADELTEVYQRCVTELVDLFTRVTAVDQEVQRVNNITDCQRKLRKVELVARGIPGFSTGDVSVIEKCQLPPLIFGHGKMVMAWPLPTVPIGVLMHDHVAAMMRGARPPTEDEKIAESMRVVKYAEEQERGRVQLNEAAAERARQSEAEQRRIAAGA